MRPRSSETGGAGASTGSIPRRRHSARAASKPSATSGSSSTSATRGERAIRRNPSPFVLRARPGERGEQRLAVLQAARHRPGVVEGRRERHQAARRHQPSRRLDRRRAADGRRDAERASRVRAGGGRRHPRGERCGRPAARPAGRPVERPRIPDLIGASPAANSCVCRCPSRTMPAASSRSQGLARAIRHLVEQPARRRERLTRDRVEIHPTGTPQRGGAPPAASCASARSAAASASSSYTRTHALIDPGSPSWLWVPSRSRMRSRQASTRLSRGGVPAREERGSLDDSGIREARHRLDARRSSRGTARLPPPPSATRARA